jgi:ParB family chromosome partitioning protein
MPESPKYLFGNDQELFVDDLVPLSPGMRLSRSEEEFEALVNSIRELGVKEAIKTRPHPDEELRALGKLEVLEGNRRVKACLHLGLPTIRGDVEDLDDEGAYILAFNLNLNRENLTGLTIANWLNFIQLKFAYSQTKLAQMCGRSQSWVSRQLKMMDFVPRAKPDQTGFTYEAEPEVLSISEKQARVLRTVPEGVREAAMLEATITGELPSAAELERRSRAEFTPEQV